MIINKFGGASIKDAESIVRTVAICRANIKHGIIVVSAMGKITNLLEKITIGYFNKQDYSEQLNEFKTFHKGILNDLFPIRHEVYGQLNLLFDNLQKDLYEAPTTDYDFEYDRIVVYGELASSLIIGSYLNHAGITIISIDIRKVLRTNNSFRNAKVMWEDTNILVKRYFHEMDTKLYLTQGFIGADKDGNNTTLGREGSDFTAAALAFTLNAKKVVVWKDVPGIMCADPAWMSDVEKIDQLSYHDAIELAFYGAKVIHPKTIKPLQNKNIPLQVRSFIDQSNIGTIINSFDNGNLPPVYIKKEDQVLISIKPTDYSFIIEENMSHIFDILAQNKVTVNLMQNSAVSFSIVVDNELFRIKEAIQALKEFYNVKFNDNLTLITIRHHKPGAEGKVLNGSEVLLEQHTRSVARYLLK